MRLNLGYDDDFDWVADRLIIRCPICGRENKYPSEDKHGATWVCCGAKISIDRKDLERIDNERNHATEWRYYGKDNGREAKGDDKV